MGLYIKGMEMPTSCDKCPFLDYEEGFCFASGVKGESGWYEFALCPGGFKGGRHDDCPLVPVPPHRRLIDGEKILEEAKRLSGPITGDGWDNWGVYALIKRQPTVIPAEEGKT